MTELGAKTSGTSAEDRAGQPTGAADIPVDNDVLRQEIRKTCAEVSVDPATERIFPTGWSWARELGYPEPELSRVPEGSLASFARSAFDDTRRKAAKFGAMGSTIRATKRVSR